MRKRSASRLLILDPTDRLLLFRFQLKTGALAGRDFWATPGGALEDDETFAAAAIRELKEETGIVVSQVGEPVAQREFEMRMSDGEYVLANEQFFVIRAQTDSVLRTGWTALEVQVMVDHKWWSADDLASTSATVWPNDLAEILRAHGW